jgi:pyruvate carboxylase subunit B
MVHPDVITIQAMLKDAGFDVPEINMNAYMQARSLTQEFMDDFLVYFIDPKNKHTSSLLVGCGLPGGMMGSMMADLKGVHNAINMFLRKDGKKELTEDELLVQLFEEVAYVWPKVGNPPLVTPFSQYVKNIALMNILQMAQGKERYSQMDKNTWDMILGKTGKLPGTLAPEIVELAKKNNYEFFTDTPQSYYPDELDKYRKEMDENGWDYGQDDEELFELAMHDRQYRDYKSGVAKTKYALRKAAAKIVPKEWAQREKKGFMVPFKYWLKEEKWYNKVKETFESEYAAKFFDTDKIVKLLNDYYEGKAMTHRKVYTIYCFLIWYKQYFVEG